MAASGSSVTEGGGGGEEDEEYVNPMAMPPAVSLISPGNKMPAFSFASELVPKVNSTVYNFSQKSVAIS